LGEDRSVREESKYEPSSKAEGQRKERQAKRQSKENDYLRGGEGNFGTRRNERTKQEEIFYDVCMHHTTTSGKLLSLIGYNYNYKQAAVFLS
jgi:hypothetical protein